MKQVILHPKTPANIKLYSTPKPKVAFWMVGEQPYFCSPTDYAWLRNKYGEVDVTPTSELNNAYKKAISQQVNIFRIMREIAKTIQGMPTSYDYEELGKIPYWGLQVFQNGLQVGQQSGVYTRNKKEWDESFQDGRGFIGERKTKHYRFFASNSHDWKLEIF